MNATTILELFRNVLHAVVCAIVVGAAYLMGVLSADAGLSDVTFVQWLGAIAAVGAAFGITQSARRAPVEP